MITFDAVTKAFPGGNVAVDDLSLELPTGQITVFVGPSGCGKTTSLRMINRTIEPTSGTISIDGEDVSKQDAALLRRKIGYVIQNAGLFPHRTIVDNIATVPLLNGVNKKQAREQAAELLTRVGLDESMATRYPAQLSGGQQQRVGVARALAADPPVMLMDEPFSAVDPIVRDGLQKEFLRLQAELGKTIAFVTHDIDEAIKLGDKVAIFREGGHLAQFGYPAGAARRPGRRLRRRLRGPRPRLPRPVLRHRRRARGRAGLGVRRPLGRRAPGARRRRPAAGLVGRRARRLRPLPATFTTDDYAAAGHRPGDHLAGRRRGPGRRRRRGRRGRRATRRSPAT